MSNPATSMTTSTTTPDIIIGSEGCSISKVVSLLKSSPTFPVFHDNWSYIAMDLETSRTLIKKLRRNFLIDTVNLADVVGDLLEEWVGRSGEKATLHKLLQILEENDMSNCADYLVKGLKVSKDDTGNVNVTVKKYCRIPPGLWEFIHGSSTSCILYTLDHQITCDKLNENLDNCRINSWTSFIDLISAPPNPNSIITEVVIVQEKNLKQLIKLQHIIKGFPKVIYVNCDNEDVARTFMEKLADMEFCKDTMSWDDLTPAFQMKITDKLNETYGIEFEEEVIDGHLLVDLINGKTPTLFKNIFPDELSYYIPRKVLSRRFISLKVFQFGYSDIFLFTGMKRYELSHLAKEEMTDGSSNQIRQDDLTVNYMILEVPNHFERICGLLHYETGSLCWIRSRGSMRTIQQCVADNNSQEETGEEDLCLKSTDAVCIADSPGMGKSVLLGQIGRILERNNRDRVVIFVVLKEFIINVKNSGFDHIPQAIEHALKVTVCENVIAEAVLKSKLHSDSNNEIWIELLIDGFDEMDTSDSEFPFEILQAVKSSFKNVRIWVTSRPHFRHKLENSLSGLGFNIQPFSKEDQIQFLNSFWASQGESLNMERIHQFSVHCLKSLTTKMSRKDRDIAGIPLQCLLIGEVYKEDAMGYARTEGCSFTEIHLDFASISDLYLRLIERKLEKYKSSCRSENFDKQTIMEVHSRLSLELIFPEQFSKLECSFPTSYISQVLEVGIVESSGTTESHRFMHKTFAEYFVAWFVMDRLKSGKGWEEEMTRFFLEGVLACRVTYQYEFIHPVITYFVDSIIGDPAANAEKLPAAVVHHITNMTMQNGRPLRNIAIACATHDFVNIFKFFEGIHAFDYHAGSIFNFYFVLCSINHSCLELVKLGMLHFEQHHSFSLDMQVEALQAAVVKGKFTHVEFLIKEKAIRGIVEDMHPGTNLLLHSCVKNTSDKTDEEIEQRVQIMRILVDINRQLGEERDDDERTPLLSSGVHIRLLILLIDLGANVLEKDQNMFTVLHNTRYTVDEYHSILTHIPENSLRYLFTLKDGFGSTPLNNLLKYLNPSTETLTIFQDREADFNSLDNEGFSVLATAVTHGRNASTLRGLIKQHGCDVGWRGRKGETLFHVAAVHASTDALEFLVEECPAHIHSRNMKEQTVLHSANFRWNNESIVKIFMFLINNGADVFAKDRHGDTFLHNYLSKPREHSNASFYELVQCLVKMDKWSLFETNGGRNGSTPLHLAVMEMELDKETMALLHAKGINFNMTDNLGRTVLSYAIFGRRSTKFISLLIELGADYKMLDGHNQNMLHISTQEGLVEHVKYFLELGGLNVNGQDCDGNTPQHCAALGKYKSKARAEAKCRLLIEKGSDPSIKNKNGDTPATIALRRK